MLSRLRLAHRLQSTPCFARQIHEYFQYTRAIIGSVNNRFVQGAIRFEEPDSPVDREKANKQHRTYVEQLKNIIPGKIVQISADDRFPDQVFTEDPAVVYDGKALLTRMLEPSRAGEKDLMKRALEEIGGFEEIYEMKNPEAHLDGGDVLFTGREFLVGLSSRTNAAGIEEFAKVFSNWSVSGIKVLQGNGVLHLKSMSSMCGVDTIAISNTVTGNFAWKEITQKARYSYKKVSFPDDNGANCVFVNGTVIHPCKEEYPESYKVWQTLECDKKIAIPNSEFSKVDGSLTCRSILIN